MDAMTILILLGLVGGAIALATPFVLITLAALIYVWTNSYPWLKMVGKWGARPANFITMLALFAVAFIIVLALAFIVHPLMLVLALPLFIILFPVGLAVIVWVIRVIKWIFFVVSGFIDSIFLAIRLEFIKLKIKTDTLKQGGSGGKVRAFKGEFSGDVRRVRGKVGGKKETGFRGKLDALRGEFSGDVERARGRIFRRKR